MNKYEIKTLLNNDGYYILKNVFNTDQLKNIRKKIFNHIELFPNTRPSPNSRHLAGFHRYSEFTQLHSEIFSNSTINELFGTIAEGEKWISIGLTDITINRSQPWHTDLLRGKYKKYINIDNSGKIKEGGVYKILLYLQEGKNLQIIPGSQNVLSELDDQSSERLAAKKRIKTVELDAGDVIIMDIRLQHAGATEEEMMTKALDDNAKILVTTVVGDSSKQLTELMMLGNTYRQIDWDKKHLSYFPN